MSYSKIRKIRLSTYDRKWSKLARERDKKCLYCGATQNLAAHHFLRRSVKATRLMLENAVTLCPSHHVFNHEFSAHKTPEAFRKWFKKTYPERAKQILQKSKTNITERQAIEEFMKLYETNTP